MNPLTHFRTRNVTLLIAAALIALMATAPAPALATPGCGVLSENLLAPVPVGNFPSGSLNLMCRSNLPAWLLNMRIRGDSDLFVTKHTFDPGGQTGWHSHPGPSLITVIQGTLTVYHDDCTVETFTAGQSFTDLGCGDMHNAVNEGATPAIDVAVQIVPHDAPRRIDVPDPGCAQPAPCPIR